MDAGSDRFRRLQAAFEAASAVARPERDALLDRLCAGDADLRREVEAMLDCHDEPDPALEDADGVLAACGEAAQAGAPAHDDASVPVLRGDYRVIRLLGEGAMGAVYEAEQASPRRLVALKVLRPGRASQEAVRRFRREAEALGRLQHPGIAQVFEAGAADLAEPEQAYIAMELVRGETLIEWSRRRGLGVRERVELMARVCDAVAHANERGIVHRDLKPANIIVCPERGPKVLDFGVAKMLPTEGEAATAHTLSGQIVGTLSHMAPEALEHGSASVDVRADVYALGVLLYELLAGRPPIDLAGLSLTAAIGRLRSAEAPALGRVDAALAGDLEAVVARAMERTPERRTASARAMQADLERWLRGERVAARPTGPVRRAAAMGRRIRMRWVVGAAAGAALVGAAGFAVVEASRARRATTDLAATTAEAEALRASLYESALALALAALESGDRAAGEAHLAGAPVELRSWEWRHLAARARGEGRAPDPGPMSVPFHREATIAPGRLARVAPDGTVEIVDSARGVTLLRLEEYGGAIRGVAALAGSEGLLAGLRDDGRVSLWRAPE